MAIGQQAAVLDGIRRIFEGATAASSGADGLLRRFAATGDEAAFAAIVARHGPMVLAVCRRALRDPHDVEDAFQATFLVLVRRAGSIRDGEALGAWLHGVARRVAMRARATSARRRERERSGEMVDPAAPPADPDGAEVVAAIDEEIGRLPDRYRRAIILCDLEGCTQIEAALRLGWSEGSIRGRLARGRELLRSRLRRRGLVAPGAAIGGLVASDAASATRLGEALARGLARLGTGGVAVGVGEAGVSTRAILLAKEVLWAMMRHKLLAVGLMAFAAGSAISGAGVAGAYIAKSRHERAEVAAKLAAAEKAVDAAKAAQEGADQLAESARKLAELSTTALSGTPAVPSSPPGSGQPLPPLPPGAAMPDEQPGDMPDPGTVLRSPPAYLPPLPSPEDQSKPPGPEPAGTRKIAPGDVLVIEVLEALPGRPITGERFVRPDGTISLGFYGDLPVAGLTRREVKVKAIEHLRQYLTDQTLGLIRYAPAENKFHWVHPAYSSCAFVDDSLTFEGRRHPSRPEAPPVDHEPGPPVPGAK
jgi:RNA polymerase sigma factor (sigma-70 family)